MAEQDFRLFVTMHQIVCDGVSVFQILTTELASFYDTFSRGETPTLLVLPVQFGDYAFWQRDTLAPELERQTSFWRRQLAGDLPVLSWPSAKERPARETFRGSIHPFTLPPSVSERIREIAFAEGVTLFTVLIAGVSAVLHGYTEQTELLLGTVSPSGRKRSEVQGLIGYFLNPVCLRLKMPDNSTVSGFLQHCYATLSEAMTYDDVPLETLAETIACSPDPSRHPFFSVATSLEPPLPALDGWSLTPMDLQTGGARWDLYVVFDDRPDSMIGRIQYNPDLLEVSDIRRFVGDLTSVLDSMSGGSHRRFSELSLNSQRTTCS